MDEDQDADPNSGHVAKSGHLMVTGWLGGSA